MQPRICILSVLNIDYVRTVLAIIHGNSFSELRQFLVIEGSAEHSDSVRSLDRVVGHLEGLRKLPIVRDDQKPLRQEI